MEGVQVHNVGDVLSWGIAHANACDEQVVVVDERTGHGVQVMEDRCTVAHAFSGSTESDTAVQGAQPCAMDCGVAYFEVSIRHCHKDIGAVTVGMGHRGCLPTRSSTPGKSYLFYKSESGKKSTNAPSIDAAQYGSKFTTGDVIGCGFIRRTRDIFFTKNGRHLGIAYSLSKTHHFVQDHIYPTASLQHATITFHFEKPFKWDASGLVAQEKAALLKAAEAPTSSSPEPAVMSELVAAYLLHHGYTATATALRKAVPSDDSGRGLLRHIRQDAGEAEAAGAQPHTWETEAEDSRASARWEMVHSVMGGDVRKAIEVLEREFPELSESVLPVLVSQLIVETIRSGDLTEALTIASDPRCRSDAGMVHPLVAEAMGLLAYQDPASSPLAYLFLPSQSRRVADSLNAAVLAHLGYARQATLDLLIKHTLILPRIARVANAPISLKEEGGLS